MREILKLREKEGAYKLLLPKLLCDGPFYKNFLRTSKASFELLLTLIEKDIQPMNTVLRSGISAGERLAVTLRFLATGKNNYNIIRMGRIILRLCSKNTPRPTT